MLAKQAQSHFPKLLYAHRGANRLYPENTLEAFRQGLADGANALEMDIQLTKDEIPVVIHDKDGWRAAGIRQGIHETSFEGLRSWDVSAGEMFADFKESHRGLVYRIPSLVEVLDAFPNIELNLDIKPKNLRALRIVLEVIKRHQAAHRVTLNSFHTNHIKYLYQAHYEGKMGCLKKDIFKLRFLPWSLNVMLTKSAVQIPPVFMGIRLDRPSFIQNCHRHGLRVDYWVINDPAFAKSLLEMGADGIITDEPSRIFPVIAPFLSLSHTS